MRDGQVSDNEHLDVFVRLLTEHEHGVLLFILSLVPNWADAEEIRQETSVKLWQEFDKFQLGSDFGKWARTIARYEVLAFRTRKQRDWPYMSQQSMDLVAAKVATVVNQETSRPAIVAECVEELSSFGRELVRLHYTVGRKIRDIARELGCTSDSAYKALQRARLELRRCVDRKLSERKIT
jgi:RNA polymerase sigma-70 factor (ECF subfamily)